MFETFFHELRSAKVPVTLKEYLTLLEAVARCRRAVVSRISIISSRAALVKDERNLDRFDQVFAHVFKGLELTAEAIEAEIPEEWLRRLGPAAPLRRGQGKIDELGGWDKIMEELKKRLAEQKERHQGGNKWIGTGGTSPFGAYGYNPAGMRIGQHESRHRRAIKVWDKREFKDLAGTAEIGTRDDQGGATPLPPVRTHRRRLRTRSRRHDQRHRAKRAISTSTCGPSGTTP